MNSSENLTVSEAQSAAVARAPRVSHKDIERAIRGVYYAAGSAILTAEPVEAPVTAFNERAAARLTICLIVVANGFTVIGKSDPPSVDNCNPDLGRQSAYYDAIRQLWPLMGYALLDRVPVTPTPP